MFSSDLILIFIRNIFDDFDLHIFLKNAAVSFSFVQCGLAALIVDASSHVIIIVTRTPDSQLLVSLGTFFLPGPFRPERKEENGILRR
jgi:hypothetical protein